MIADKIANIVKVFKKHKITNLKEAEALGEALGYKLTYLNSGGFRDVYKFKLLPLVVKFPTTDGLYHDEDDLWGNISHSRIEMRTIRRILKSTKLKGLWPFVPKVYYFNHKNGVMLMHYYKPIRGITREGTFAGIVDQFVRNILGLVDDGFGADMCGHNMAVDEETNQYKIIDFGCCDNRLNE